MEHMRTKAKEVRKAIGEVVLNMIEHEPDSLLVKHCIQLDTKVWLMIMGAITSEIERIISRAGMTAEAKIANINALFNAAEFIHDSVLGVEIE